MDQVLVKTWQKLFLFHDISLLTGSKSNGSNTKENGSSSVVVSNGPVQISQTQESISVAEAVNKESAAAGEAGQEEEKSVQCARSTDLIFLKSVVQSNTLERPKKVS